MGCHFQLCNWMPIADVKTVHDLKTPPGFKIKVKWLSHDITKVKAPLYFTGLLAPVPWGVCLSTAIVWVHGTVAVPSSKIATLFVKRYAKIKNE